MTVLCVARSLGDPAGLDVFEVLEVDAADGQGLQVFHRGRFLFGTAAFESMDGGFSSSPDRVMPGSSGSGDVVSVRFSASPALSTIDHCNCLAHAPESAFSPLSGRTGIQGQRPPPRNTSRNVRRTTFVSSQSDQFSM